MRGSRIPTLCALGGLLLLAVISARGSSAIPAAPRGIDIEADVQPSSGADDLTEPTPPRDLPSPITERPEVVGNVSLVIAGVLILIAILIVVLRAIWPRRRREWTGIPQTEDIPGDLLRGRLSRAAERAHATLTARTGGPPGDAVIAAWLTLEEATAHEGAGREPHQTSTEFTAALLASHTTDEAALTELRALYQRARFGQPGAVGEREVDAATAALDRVLRGMHDTPAPA